jgi:hypothetical protein
VPEFEPEAKNIEKKEGGSEVTIRLEGEIVIETKHPDGHEERVVRKIRFGGTIHGEPTVQSGPPI